MTTTAPGSTSLRESLGWDSDLRRSLRHRFLRWQAKLEGSGPDRFLPWGIAVVLFVLFSALALARYRSLDLGEPFAAWLQGVWLLGQGEAPTVTVTGRSLFEGQLSIIMWPIAQLARIVPAAPLLLTLQAAALALGVVPLWRIARGVLELGVETALMLAVAYGFQPELHNLNLSEFHPEALAVPAFLYAYLYSQREQWWRFALVVALALSTRSDLGLVVIGLGALLAIEGRTRAGRITAAAGAVWAVLALLVFQADLAGGEFVYSEAFARYGDGPVSILWGMLTNPIDVLTDFVSEDNFSQLLFLFAPWLFLPLLKLRFQLPLILFGAFSFIADIPPGEFGNPQQEVAALAFLPIATAYALRTVGRRSVRRVFVNGRLLAGVLFATMTFHLFAAGSSLYREPWLWGTRDTLELDAVLAIETVGPDESVSAVDWTLPLLAERRDLIGFPMDVDFHRPNDPTFRRCRDGQVTCETFEAVQVIIVDEADPRWTALARGTFDQIVGALDYEVTHRFGSISVYRFDTSE
jgi:uncharacterized membrane protein